MATADLLAPVSEGEPAPLYWICGKERYLVERAVAILKERVLDPRTRDFNYDSVYAKEAGPHKVISLARIVPMMSRRRLVLVRDADVFEAKEFEVLSPYCSKPAPETCLIFVAEKADARLKFFNVIKKTGVLLKFEPLAERQLPGFVRDEFRRRKLRCNADAAELLVAEVGPDLGQLVDAVERLQLYVGERQAVEAADVEAVVTTTRTRSVFELSDAIGEGDGARALAALGSLLKAREPGLRILAMIARQVRLLLTTRGLLDEGTPKRALAEALALPPFVADKLEAQARRLDASSLVAMHRAVYRTDQLLKSSRLDDERWLELLVLELVQQRKQTNPTRRSPSSGR